MNSRFRLMCVLGAADPSFASHHFKKDSDAPDPNPGMLKQAEISEKLGERSLDIYEAQNARNEARYDELMPLYKQVIDAQLGQMDSQSKLAEDYDAYNKTTFRPLEQRIVRDAEEFDSAANQEAAAGRASADVIAAYDRNRTNLTRTMGGLGVNMASPAAIAAMKDMSIDQAGATAGAQNRAREQVKTIGRAMRMDAASIGRGLPSAQATSASLAVNAGNAATGNAAQQSQGYLAGNQAAQGWFNTGVGAHGQAGSIYGQEYNARLNGWNAAQANDNSGAIWGAVGSVAGSFFGPMGAAAGAAIGKRFKDGGEITPAHADGNDGGVVDGPGTETSDDVDIKASVGEYVLNAEAVRHIGVKNLDKLNKAGLAERKKTRGFGVGKRRKS